MRWRTSPVHGTWYRYGSASSLELNTKGHAEATKTLGIFGKCLGTLQVQKQSSVESLRFGIKAVSLSVALSDSFHKTHRCSTGFILPCLPFLTNCASRRLSLGFFLFLPPALSPLLPLAVFLDLSVVVFFSHHLFLSLFIFLVLSTTFCRMACLTAGLLSAREKRSVLVVVVVVASRWRGSARSR